LDSLAKQSRSAWAVAFTTKVLDFDGDVLTLLFQSQKDVDAFKNSGGAADVLRQVIRDVSGANVKYRAKVAEAPSKVTPAPQVESNPDEFSEPEEVEEEEAKTEQLPQAEQGQSGEYMLRNILGAQPLKGES
jgi:DNA polymerase-3 subunit gamma/tau